MASLPPPAAGVPLARTRRVLAWGLRLIGAAGLVVAFLGCCVFTAPMYDGPVTDHFDGDVFHNDPPAETRTGDFLRWRMRRNLGPWDEWTESEPGAPPPERVTGDRLRVTFVNHSTVLLQMGGVNVLTDPVWSKRVSPVSFGGPVRRRAPGLRFEDLPPIDVVVISHNHYDHMDVATLKRLAEEHAPLILAGLGNKRFLESRGVTGVRDLDWWEAATIDLGGDAGDEVRITCVPVRHFSGRGFTDRNGTLWCGFVVESAEAGRAYFAGDTGYGRHFADARERMGPMRLSVLPIGSYLPRWFMSPVHIDPAGAVRAHRALEAGTSVGVHFGTFALADDGQYQPEADLAAALERVDGPPPRFWVLGFGEGRDVPALPE